MIRVFYANWQLECCGTGFAVGDSVTWTAIPPEAELDGLGVDWIEEHHADDTVTLTALAGRVADIRLVRRDDERYLAAESTTHAGGWESGEGFAGYLVALDERPAGAA